MIVVIALTAKVVQSATAGVSGRTQRQMKAESIAIVAAYIATGVVQGALQYEGTSHAIVYGVFPAAAPLVIVGGTLAGAAGARQGWPVFGTALVVVAIGVGAAFAGPAEAWAVVGVGLFFAVLGYGAASAWLRRSVTVRA